MCGSVVSQQCLIRLPALLCNKCSSLSHCAWFSDSGSHNLLSSIVCMQCHTHNNGDQIRHACLPAWPIYTDIIPVQVFTSRGRHRTHVKSDNKLLQIQAAAVVPRHCCGCCCSVYEAGGNQRPPYVHLPTHDEKPAAQPLTAAAHGPLPTPPAVTASCCCILLLCFWLGSRLKSCCISDYAALKSSMSSTSPAAALAAASAFETTGFSV